MAANNPLRQDPTRTAGVRRQYLAKIRARFKRFASAVKDLVWTKDVFGLATNADARDRQWAFQTSERQSELFRDWLGTQIELDLLEALNTSEEWWWDQYIQQAYQKGYLRSFSDMNVGKLSKLVEDGRFSQFYEGSKEQFLKDSFFKNVSSEKLKLLSARVFTEMEGMTDAMARELKRGLIDGLIEGLGPREIARKLEDAIGVSARRAETIARTEIIRAHAEGQLDSLERQGAKELKVMVEWSTAGDHRVCPRCADKEGLVIKIEEARGMIPLHPNCVTGEMRIWSPGPLSVFRSKYTGPIVEIQTAKGRFLSITANHVLLTQRGWVQAKAISETDYLIDATLLNGSLGQSPNDNQNISSVQDCFAALAECSGVVFQGAANARSEDFHGDGKLFTEEVHVQGFDRCLWNDFQSRSFSEFSEKQLVARDVFGLQSFALDRQRLFSSLLIAAAAASDSVMGFQDIHSVFVRGSFGHHQTVGVGLSSQSNASQQQPRINQPTTPTEVLRELIAGDAGLVKVNELLHHLAGNVYAGLGQRLGGGSHDAFTMEEFTKRFRIALKFLSDSTNGQSCLVEFDGLVQDRVDSTVSRHVIDLQVYDMETSESVYMVEGVLSSNCRCAWIPANVGE